MNQASPLIPPAMREDLPLYPPILQLLRVTATTVSGPAGVVQTAGSSVLGPTLYVAFIQQMRTDALLPRDREPCLADDVNGFGLVPGYYLGRLAGSHTSLPVYEVTDTGAQFGDRPRVLKITNATPLNGLYQAVLQSRSGGNWIDGTAIWALEGNDAGLLILNERYLGVLVSIENGRDVYALCDFNLTVRDEDLAGHDRTLYAELGPSNNWTITRPGTRRTLFKRILDVFEGATLKMQFVKKLIFDATDFDVTGGAAGSGDVTINTEGFTGSFDVVVTCTAGVLRVKCLTFTRGLLKTVGAERDLGSGSCP